MVYVDKAQEKEPVTNALKMQIVIQNIFFLIEGKSNLVYSNIKNCFQVA